LVLVQPASSGTITIGSSSPFDQPLINPAYFSAPVDMELLIEGIRTAKRFFSGPTWAEVLGAPLFPDPDVLPRAEFEAITKPSVFSGIHGIGTAAMSKKGGKKGVVDPDLKVKGLKGLRIVDASAIPRIMSGHTQAPTYILAERAADLIAEEWGRHH